MKKLLIFISVIFTLAFANPTTFNWAIEFVLKHEGGYCHDRGSESNFGLSSKWYPKENMKTMTIERAKELYKRDYWDAIGAEMIEDSCLALVYLDCAVLFGQPAAKKMLKKSFNGFTYDKSVLRGFYIDRIVAQIKTCPDDSKYLKSWMTRIADLSAVANIQ
jgi:hypothetical protein